MKKLNLFALITLMTLLVSCKGVRFANAPVNKELPKSFTQRAIYPGGVSAYEFQDLVGNIIHLEINQDPIRIGVIRPPSYINEVIPIEDPLNYYRSRIQKGAELKGNYLAFAANFKADQMAELTLVDIARASITFDKPDVFENIKQQAEEWVNDHPLKNSNTKRLWIKSVVLTRRIYQEHIKIEANASGQVGDVVGVEAGVYAKNENEVKSVIVAFEAFDIDKFVSETTQEVSFRQKSVEEITDVSLFNNIIEGKIRDLPKQED